MSEDATSQVLEDLFGIIDSRRGASAESSYTASLFADGRGRIARKLGEESVETVVAALEGQREQVVKESADLLYHALVLWADMGIEPVDVWAELERRAGTSGIEEKNSRG